MTRSPFEGVAFVPFVERVLGVRLSLGQRTLAKVALDDVPPAELVGEERDMAAALFGPDVETVPPAARSVVDIVAGARGGKSYVFGGCKSLHAALTVDLSSMAPGERASALIVSPDLRLSRQALRFGLGAARSCPALASAIGAVSKDGFDVSRPDGKIVRVEALPAARAGSSLRGRSLAGATFDEAAFFRDDSGAVCDGDLFRAVHPRLLPGAKLILCSTPWLESGLLYELHEKNWNRPSDALAARAPTLTLWPSERNREAVARELARDEGNAKREFFAEWTLGGAGQWFDKESLRAAIDSSLSPATSCAAGGAVIGLDIGLQNDASAAVVLHRGEGGVWHIGEILCLRPRRGAPLSLERVVTTFLEMARRHGCTSARCDHFLISESRRHAGAFPLLPIPGGAAGKTSIYLTARDALRRGLLKIPKAYAWIAEEMSQIVSAPLPAGGTKITAPRRAGSHADSTSALVAACWQAWGASLTTIEDWDPIVPTMRGSERSAIAPAGGIDSRVGSETGYLIDGVRFAVEDAGAIIETRPRPGHAGAGWPIM